MKPDRKMAHLEGSSVSSTLRMVTAIRRRSRGAALREENLPRLTKADLSTDQSSTF